MAWATWKGLAPFLPSVLRIIRILAQFSGLAPHDAMALWARTIWKRKCKNSLCCYLRRDLVKSLKECREVYLKNWARTYYVHCCYNIILVIQFKYSLCLFRTMDHTYGLKCHKTAVMEKNNNKCQDNLFCWENKPVKLLNLIQWPIRVWLQSATNLQSSRDFCHF